MTATDRTRPVEEQSPQTDRVALRLRRRHWAILALAVLLLGGVLRAACYLTVLTPATAAAEAWKDPWGPRLPASPLTDAHSRQLARLLHLDAPHTKGPAETPAPAGPVLLDPAVKLLVDHGWPAHRSKSIPVETIPPATIPAAARTAGIVAVSDKASP
ncbi:hypothetical protein GBZ48_11380 [Azospirillum melinis]|uniref:Uncharacterized protein n=1 Tax=Azospirillum melinis TaxID=328839 RepID=A0ABX2KB12_9PROT|nr:hypothetical protein [Azospirillum melinis]MBP2308173.1 hypothetical protein [Azospirillum melinis]NUA99892.1 hypothetical protein [Azospirillum melinis]